MTNDPGTAVTSLAFTEEMKGYVTLGERDFEAGFHKGKKSGTFLMFHLTIEAEDIDRFIADPEHAAPARGWVKCEALGGQLPVEKGLFNLFVATAKPMLKKMRYRLYFSDGAGDPLTLTGFKDIKDDPGIDFWLDTTTLYVRILRGHVNSAAEADAEVVASGILHIYMLDFAKQLTTFRARGQSPAARKKALSDFGRLFLGELWELYRGKAEAALTHEGRDNGRAAERFPASRLAWGKTRQLRSQVDIQAPPDRVWEVLTSFSTFPSWNPFIREAQGKLQPGARLKIKLRLGRWIIPFSPVLTVVDKPRELRWLARQGMPGLFDVDRRFVLQPLDGSGCRFVQSESGSGIFAPLFMLIMGGRILRGYEEFNAAIKERVEGAPQ